MPMPTPDMLAIIGSIIGSTVGVGIALAALIVRINSRIDRYLAEAGNDRRALQSSMDEFRQQMQRLAERQSHVEGSRDTRPDPGPVPAE